MIDFTIKLLAIFSLMGVIGVIGGVVYILKNKFIKEDKYWDRFLELSSKWGAKTAFIVALGSTVGSLFLSEIANFEACTLCWVQRGLMYPLTLLLAVVVTKKIKGTREVGLGMSMIGAVLAGYQYYLQITHNPFAPCSTGLFAASCSDRYINEFGFVTIPFMSLVGFLLITLLIYFSGATVNES